MEKKTTLSGVAFLERLSIPELETRLTEIRAEESALRTLLRSLKARNRIKKSQPSGTRNV